jgi:hypothetical protein
MILINNLYKLKKETVMKLFAIFLSAMFLVFALACNGQTKTYEIYFTANPVLDSVVTWGVHLEVRQSNSGFTLYDDMPYDSLTLAPFRIGTITNTGQVGEVTFDVELSLNGGWAIPGIIAFGEVPSDLGAGGSKKLTKKPGKPGGVGIREKQ